MNASPDQARVAVILALQKNGFLRSEKSAALGEWRDQSNEELLKEVIPQLQERSAAKAFNKIMQQFGGFSTSDPLAMHQKLETLLDDASKHEAKIGVQRAIGLYGASPDNRQLLAAFLLLFAGADKTKLDSRFSRNDASEIVAKQEKIISHVKLLARNNNGCGHRVVAELMRLMERASKSISQSHGRNQTPGLSTNKKEAKCMEAIAHLAKYLRGAESSEYMNRGFGAGDTIKAADEVSGKSHTRTALLHDKTVPLSRLGVVARVFLGTDLSKAQAYAAKSNQEIMTELGRSCLQPNAPSWALAMLSHIDPDFNAVTAHKYSSNLSTMTSEEKQRYGDDQNDACNRLLNTVKMLLETAIDPPPTLPTTASPQEKKIQAALHLGLVPFPRDSIKVEENERTQLAQLLSDESMFKQRIGNLLSHNKYFDPVKRRVLGELSLRHLGANLVASSDPYESFLWDFLSKVNLEETPGASEVDAATLPSKAAWVNEKCEENLCPDGDCKDLMHHYRQWALVLHPDKNSTDPAAVDAFVQLMACKRRMQHRTPNEQKHQELLDASSPSSEHTKSTGRFDTFWQCLGIFSMFTPIIHGLVKMMGKGPYAEVMDGVAVVLMELGLGIGAGLANIPIALQLFTAASKTLSEQIYGRVSAKENGEIKALCDDEGRRWHLLNCLRLNRTGGPDCDILKAGGSLLHSVMLISILLVTCLEIQDAVNPLSPGKYLWVLDLASHTLTGKKPVQDAVEWTGKKLVQSGVAMGSALGESGTAMIAAVKRKIGERDSGGGDAHMDAKRRKRDVSGAGGDAEAEGAMAAREARADAQVTMKSSPTPALNIIAEDSFHQPPSTEMRASSRPIPSSRLHFAHSLASKVTSAAAGFKAGFQWGASKGTPPAPAPRNEVKKKSLKQKTKPTRTEMIFGNLFKPRPA